MSKLRLDDRVEITVVGNVTALRDGGKYIETDNGVFVNVDTPGLKVRRLRRPKPPAGTVLTGRQIANDWWWKRGTIFRLVESERGKPLAGFAGLVLRADGLLYDLDHGYHGDGEPFSSLAPDAKFELRYVA